jgi:hypothetical protein
VASSRRTSPAVIWVDRVKAAYKQEQMRSYQPIATQPEYQTGIMTERLYPGRIEKVGTQREEANPDFTRAAVMFLAGQEPSCVRISTPA